MATKRAFLERKGLTNAEIDEAFKRVPEETPAAAGVTAQPTPLQGQNQGLVTYRAQPGAAGAQPQAQPQVAAPAQQQALVPAQPMQLTAPQGGPPAQPVQQPIRWTQVR